MDWIESFFEETISLLIVLRLDKLVCQSLLFIDIPDLSWENVLLFFFVERKFCFLEGSCVFSFAHVARIDGCTCIS